jgi:RNA polymerase sigma factor (sigma-70 family)
VKFKGNPDAEQMFLDNTREGNDLVGGYLQKRDSYMRFLELFVDRESLVQEMRLAFWKACQTWNPRRSALATYGYSCMHHRAGAIRDFYLSKQNCRPGHDRLVVPTNESGELMEISDPAPSPDATADVEALEAAIAQLEPFERRLIRCKFFEAETFKVISKMRRISRQALEKQIPKILTKLHRMLKDPLRNHRGDSKRARSWA